MLHAGYNGSLDPADAPHVGAEARISIVPEYGLMLGRTGKHGPGSAKPHIVPPLQLHSGSHTQVMPPCIPLTSEHTSMSEMRCFA